MESKVFWGIIEDMFHKPNLCTGECKEEWQKTEMIMRPKSVF